MEPRNPRTDSLLPADQLIPIPGSLGDAINAARSTVRSPGRQRLDARASRAMANQWQSSVRVLAFSFRECARLRSLAARRSSSMLA